LNHPKNQHPYSALEKLWQLRMEKRKEKRGRLYFIETVLFNDIKVGKKMEMKKNLVTNGYKRNK